MVVAPADADKLAPEQNVRFVGAESDRLVAKPVVDNPSDPITPTVELAPLVIDLDGDGVELLNAAQSPVAFDLDGDGAWDRMGWTNGDDGFLALDRNGDGVITPGAEISFTQDVPGAKTDLEGLKAYDTNNDGWLDAADARFGEFRIWRDPDLDAIDDPGETASLADAGIVRIGLVASDAGGGAHREANAVNGEIVVHWEDGRYGIGQDVLIRGFAGDPVAEAERRRDRDAVGRRAPAGAWAFDADLRRSLFPRNVSVSGDGAGRERLLGQALASQSLREGAREPTDLDASMQRAVDGGGRGLSTMSLDEAGVGRGVGQSSSTDLGAASGGLRDAIDVFRGVRERSQRGTVKTAWSPARASLDSSLGSGSDAWREASVTADDASARAGIKQDAAAAIREELRLRQALAAFKTTGGGEARLRGDADEQAILPLAIATASKSWSAPLRRYLD
jgi:hypothetical protein